VHLCKPKRPFTLQRHITPLSRQKQVDVLIPDKVKLVPAAAVVGRGPGTAAGAGWCVGWFGRRPSGIAGGGAAGAAGAGGAGGLEGSIRERSWTVEVEGSSVQVPIEGSCEWVVCQYCHTTKASHKWCRMEEHPTFIFNPGFRLCTTTCGLWSSFASKERTTPLGMNRRYRRYVIKCVTFTHAFSLRPAWTSACKVGKDSRKPRIESGSEWHTAMQTPLTRTRGCSTYIHR
jgi:hypothetical protein